MDVVSYHMPQGIYRAPALTNPIDLYPQVFKNDILDTAIICSLIWQAYCDSLRLGPSDF